MELEPTPIGRMRRGRAASCTATSAAALVWLLAATPAPAQPGGGPGGGAGDVEMPRVAQAEIEPLDGGDVNGTITFQQQGELVRVSGVVRNLAPGKHGFHVHEGTSCEQRGGHFAPAQEPHGSPDEQARHVGDLGNLVADEQGEAAYLRLDRKLALTGPRSIVGHVLVVHRDEDDYVSQPSGSSGPEIACGRIELEGGGEARSGG